MVSREDRRSFALLGRRGRLPLHVPWRIRKPRDFRLVAVVMVLGFAHRHDAAVGDFAFHVLELDGGVGDAEAVVEDFFYIAQNSLAR